METFAERQQRHRVERLCQSTNGTVYFQYDDRAVPRYVIRHLDGRLPPRLGKRVAQLAYAMSTWLAQHGLSKQVWVDQPIEVQQDFVVWPFHLDFEPIRFWDEPDGSDDLPPLPELPEMRNAVAVALRSDTNPDVVVHGAVRRSLLGPSSLTYYDLDVERFVVVEPVVDADELDAWSP